jgi:hypothetical protein
VSNEVKLKKDEPINGVVFYDETRSQKSSVFEAPQEPLFEMNIKDESQSNLLKFGFTVGRNGKVFHE